MNLYYKVYQLNIKEKINNQLNFKLLIKMTDINNNNFNNESSKQKKNSKNRQKNPS